MIIDLNDKDSFQNRHNSPSEKEIEEMLTVIGVNTTFLPFPFFCFYIYVSSKSKLDPLLNRDYCKLSVSFPSSFFR